MAERGQCEFMRDLARPLPAKVIATLLDIDPERLSDYGRWTEATIVDEPERLDAATEKRFEGDQRERDAFITDHVKECRSGRRRGFFSTEVVPHLTDEEAIDVITLLLVAGHKTTTHLIANVVVTLLQNPDVEDSLRADTELIPAVVEETMRINGPVLGVLRRTARDVTLAGQRLPANAQVLALLGSANRSEEKFADADRFSLERGTHGHLGFGKGAHYCIGAGLGRLEAKIVLETLLERLEVIEAAERLDEMEWEDPNTQMRGPKRLKLNVRAFS
jgi:cytochrome P450